MKRYSIEKVYREKRMPSLHPMERTECAFDIIMTTPISGVPEAEVLQIVEQVINEYSILQVHLQFIARQQFTTCYIQNCKECSCYL